MYPLYPGRVFRRNQQSGPKITFLDQMTAMFSKPANQGNLPVFSVSVLFIMQITQVYILIL